MKLALIWNFFNTSVCWATCWHSINNIHRKRPREILPTPFFRWKLSLRKCEAHVWLHQGKRRSQGFVETFLCLAEKDEAVLWMDLCIMSSMKCLSTVVRYVRVDFNERNDVLISYIEMHVNFWVYFKMRNWKQLLVKKIGWLPLNVVCKSANNLKLDLMLCFYNILYGE